MARVFVPLATQTLLFMIRAVAACSSSCRLAQRSNLTQEINSLVNRSDQLFVYYMLYYWMLYVFLLSSCRNVKVPSFSNIVLYICIQFGFWRTTNTISLYISFCFTPRRCICLTGQSATGYIALFYHPSIVVFEQQSSTDCHLVLMPVGSVIFCGFVCRVATAIKDQNAVVLFGFLGSLNNAQVPHFVHRRWLLRYVQRTQDQTSAVQILIHIVDTCTCNFVQSA